MKFSILLLFGLTTIFINSTLATNYPITTNYEVAVPTGLLNDFFEWIKNVATGTSKTFLKVINTIINKIMSIIQKWKGTNIEVVIRLGSQLFKLKDLADDYLIMLGDQIHEILDGFESSINIVLDKLSFKFDEAMDKANHTLFNATTQLQDWRDAIELKLITAKPTKYEEGMKIIEEFSNKSISNVYSCSEGAIKPIRNLFDKCEKLINETLPIAGDLVDNVQSCILDGGWDISGIQTCLGNIKDAFILIIREFPAKIIKLKADIALVVIEELFNLPCIAGSRVQIEIGKNKINKLIDEIINEKLLLA